MAKTVVNYAEGVPPALLDRLAGAEKAFLSAAETVLSRFERATWPEEKTLRKLVSLDTMVRWNVLRFIRELLQEKLPFRKMRPEDIPEADRIRARGAVLARLRYTKCGKSGCRCAVEGPIHGPYWYAQWTDLTGKTRTRYVGKTWTAEKIKDVVG